jgi:hypothetical protein
VTEVLASHAPVGPMALSGRRAVLVIAHPGHELRIHGWLELARPTVCVLTDGSGHSASPRLASSSAILTRAGARLGPVFGRLTDRAIYAAVLARDTRRFADLAVELADVIVAEGADYVVGDALEGYNPAHDLCHVLVATVVALVGGHVTGWDFPLMRPPDAYPAPPSGSAVTLALDDAAFARKLAAARAYPELTGEVVDAMSRETPVSFRRECLRPASATAIRGTPPEDPPYYETYGERQVAAGRYTEVIRWRAHMARVVSGLCERLGLDG